MSRTAASIHYAERAVRSTFIPSVWLMRQPGRYPVQGSLDPLALLAGGEALDRPIFNFGHGILPETSIAYVEQILARVCRQ